MKKHAVWGLLVLVTLSAATCSAGWKTEVAVGISKVITKTMTSQIRPNPPPKQSPLSPQRQKELERRLKDLNRNMTPQQRENLMKLREQKQGKNGPRR